MQFHFVFEIITGEIFDLPVITILCPDFKGHAYGISTSKIGLWDDKWIKTSGNHRNSLYHCRSLVGRTSYCMSNSPLLTTNHSTSQSMLYYIFVTFPIVFI